MIKIKKNYSIIYFIK